MSANNQDSSEIPELPKLCQFWKVALSTTIPVLFGYVPMGIAFGVLFSDLGYAWYYATLMAVCIYAGTAQFMAIGLLAAGAGLWETAMATLLLNFRHVFYGISLLKTYAEWDWRKFYLIFSLTDEAYALTVQTSIPKGIERKHFLVCLSALNQLYWVLGCTIGAIVGNLIDLDTEGLEFVVTALFTVLVYQQWQYHRQLLPFVIAGISMIISFAFFTDQVLVIAIIFSMSLLLLCKPLLRVG